MHGATTKIIIIISIFLNKLLLSSYFIYYAKFVKHICKCLTTVICATASSHTNLHTIYAAMITIQFNIQQLSNFHHQPVIQTQVSRCLHFLFHTKIILTKKSA